MLYGPNLKGHFVSNIYKHLKQKIKHFCQHKTLYNNRMKCQRYGGTYSGFDIGFRNEIFDVQGKANSEEQIMKSLNKDQATTVN